MAGNLGVLGNTDIAPPAGVLNDVWDQTNHSLRTEASSLSGTSITNVQRVTSGAGAPGQSLKTYQGSQLMTGGGSVALETVTAGKTFYITDIHFSTNNASATVINIQAAGTSIFPSVISTTSSLDMAGIDTQPLATTGQAVTILFPNVAFTLYYFVSGYEQ